jgi:hypothetical protein
MLHTGGGLPVETPTIDPKTGFERGSSALSKELEMLTQPDGAAVAGPKVVFAGGRCIISAQHGIRSEGDLGPMGVHGSQ